MKKTIKIAIVILLVSRSLFAQQQAQYTQNQFNSNLIINPAYAGSSECSSLGLRLRDQWVGLDGAPVTLGLIGEMKLIERLYGGICINYDKIGIYNTFSVDGNVAYHVKLSEKAKLAVGLKAGASFIHSDFGKLVNISPSDPLYHTSANFTIPYVGVGVLYYTNKYYLGASAPTLVSFENTSVRGKVNAEHYYLYGGIRLPLNEDYELRPALLTKYQPAAPLEFDLAMDIWFKQRLGFGVSYRTGDAVNCMLKVKYKQFYFGYSYDIPLSDLRSFNYGSHEVFLGLEFCHKKASTDDANKNIRYF